MKPLFTYGKKSAGRPPVVELSESDLDEIRATYVAGTNRNSKEGSILLAWVKFCEDHPDQFGHLVADHMPATTIPSAVTEACRTRKALIGAARGGAARLRHEAAYVPGTMRRHHSQERRLWAGERASVDDATRNVACWIPWTWGGCPCSEKYGVRLGRWQTLIVHDDATSFVPFVSSVFRWQQSYRATDAASVIYRAEREVLQWDQWAIEGGVWQAKRTLDVLGGRFYSAKGRPNQKLVENFIGRLWGIMAGQRGDVGRHRGEIKAASDLYIKARDGRVDPRKHFMSLPEAQEQLYSAITYLSEKRIVSRVYGSWIPKDRWERDLAEAPRAARSNDEDFLVLPVAATRTVRSGMIKVREDGPQGVPMEWSFAAEWLWQYEGRKVTVYFDPMEAWPVDGVVTLERSRKKLGAVECINTFGESRDRAAEIVKSIRQTMMMETRVLSTAATVRTLRHSTGVITTTGGAVPAAPAPAPEIIAAPSPRTSRELSAKPSRNVGDDLAISLSRRAQRLRETDLNHTPQ